MGLHLGNRGYRYPFSFSSSKSLETTKCHPFKIYKNNKYLTRFMNMVPCLESDVAQLDDCTVLRESQL
jgi:hypothetical protein